MESELYQQEFNKMFKWFTNDVHPGLLKLELGIYKNLLNFFLAGDSYYFILNHTNLACEIVSKEVEYVIGCHPSEFSLAYLNETIHPDDRQCFLIYGNKITEFFSQLPTEKLMKYKVRSDFRYRKKNGDYTRLLYQGLIIEHDDDGKLLRTLNIHTDINYLKQEGRPLLSFIGIDGEPSYTDDGYTKKLIDNKESLTRREKQILELLIEGKLSKEIGSILKISKQTVDTHRKNMLHKNNLSNTGELIGKAIKYGWI